MRFLAQQQDNTVLIYMRKGAIFSLVGSTTNMPPKRAKTLVRLINNTKPPTK